MRRRRPASRLVLGAVLCLTCAWARDAQAWVTTFACAGASSCTLAELLAGGSIQVNYTRFENWELEFIDPDGVQPDFNLIVVAGKDDGGLVPGDGIAISGNGQLSVSGPDRLDMAIGFTATDISANLAIQGNSLALLSYNVLTSSLSTFVTVGEFVADASGVGLGQKEVDSDPVLSDTIAYTLSPAVGYTKLIVEKDILLQSTFAGESAELDVYEQRFALPEPGQPLLLGAGVVGLWALHRLRSRRSTGGRRISST